MKSRKREVLDKVDAIYLYHIHFSSKFNALGLFPSYNGMNIGFIDANNRVFYLFSLETKLLQAINLTDYGVTFIKAGTKFYSLGSLFKNNIR